MYEVTLQFTHYTDLLNIMKVLRSKDIQRKSQVHGFTGSVGVVLGYEILASMPESLVSQYRAEAR